jgi:hypothetical protein
MFNKLSNKELVTVIHDLAKTLSADAKFLDVAKLLAESATRLDVAIARGNELLRKAEEAEALMLAMRDDSIESRSKLELLTAENAVLKSNLIYWDDEDGEPVSSPLDIACSAGMPYGTEFEVQVAARMPNLTYRVCAVSKYSCEIELVEGALPDTPATDAMVNDIRAEGVELYADATIAIGKAENDEAIIYAGNQALLFANQLRADVAKGGD